MIRFFLNNIEFGGPKEWKGMEVELNFDSEAPTASISGGTFTFMAEAADILNDWIEDGFIFEGCPYRIEIDGNVLFDGYVDLADDSTELSCDVVRAKIVETGSIDWLNDIADSATVDSIYLEDGILSESDFVDVPYVISEIPDYVKSFTAFVSAYIMYMQIKEIVKSMSAASSQAANPTSAIVAILSVISLVVYIALSIISIILLLKQMITSLIQPLKYHQGMKVKRIVEGFCEKFNLELRSPGILEHDVYKNLLILPKKYSRGRVFRKTKKSKGKGRELLAKLEDLVIGREVTSILQTGSMPKTFGDILRDLQTIFKAQVFLQKRDNGRHILYIVPDRFEFSESTFQLRDVYSEFNGTNASELNSNMEIMYTLDSSEYNTLDSFEDAHVQVTTSQITTRNSNVQFRLAKGLESVQIPYARSIRKNDLTFVESFVNFIIEGINALVNVMIKIYNGLISAINLGIKLTNAFIRIFNGILPPLLNTTKPLELFKTIPKKPVNGVFKTLDVKRIGSLLLSQDQFSVDKIMIFNNGKIEFNSLEVLSPKFLYFAFHKQAVSFVPSKEYPNANQYFRYSVENHPFCVEDYLKLKRNKNRILNAQGELSEIDSLNWNPFTNTADIEYRVNRKYTDNLKETVIVDGESKL